MTDDYKENLLKYLTGKMPQETGNNEPQFIDQGTINQNPLDYLNNYFEYGARIVGQIQQENIDYILLYGIYYANQAKTSSNGFIYIVTKDMESVSLITEYDSGTEFRPFRSLNIDEDGYIYGFDDASDSSKDYRFIMLNKVISAGAKTGTFKVKLRQSYYFDSSIKSQIFSFYGFGNHICTKKIGSADYFIFVTTPINNSYGIGVINFKINVGSANEWGITKSSYINDTNHMCFVNQYDNSGNLQILIGGFADNYTYKEIIYNYTDTPTITLRATFPSLTSLHAGGAVGNTIKLALNNTYIAYKWGYTEGEPAYNAIYKLNYNNNTYEEVQTFSNTFVFIGGSISFYNIETELFFKYYWISGEENAYISNTYIGLIVDKDVYYIEAQNYNYSTTTTSGVLFITKVFNLYDLCFTLDNSKEQKIQLIYNVNNYNGLPYEALNSLVPNSSVLYDSSDNVIFARNLYNKTVSGQTTTSIVQVPNTLLNDTTIAKNELLGQTNVVLVDDDTEITKNIYETVDLNFSNTIIIRNDNDINNKILNPTGASRLNDSVSQTVDYSNTQATKLKINYADGTNNVIQLDSSQIDEIDETTFQYTFTLYVSKEINNIQIISYDEDTVYQTISNLNLIIGNTYNFTQNVEVL